MGIQRGLTSVSISLIASLFGAACSMNAPDCAKPGPAPSGVAVPAGGVVDLDKVAVKPASSYDQALPTSFPGNIDTVNEVSEILNEEAFAAYTIDFNNSGFSTTSKFQTNSLPVGAKSLWIKIYSVASLFDDPALHEEEVDEDVSDETEPIVLNLENENSLSTIKGTASRGMNVFEVRIHDDVGASGNVLAKSSISIMLDGGKTNSISLVLARVIKSLVLSLPEPVDTNTATLAISAFDAVGRKIVGPFNEPVSLSVDDPALALSSRKFVRSDDLIGVTISGSQTKDLSVTAQGKVSGASGRAIFFRPPSLISPATGTRHNSGDVTFNWGAVTGANRYRLKISGNEVMKDGDYFEPEPGVISCTKALTSGTYYWQVQSIGNNEKPGWGVFGPTPPFKLDVHDQVGSPPTLTPPPTPTPVQTPTPFPISKIPVYQFHRGNSYCYNTSTAPPTDVAGWGYTRYPDGPVFYIEPITSSRQGTTPLYQFIRVIDANSQDHYIVPETETGNLADARSVSGNKESVLGRIPKNWESTDTQQLSRFSAVPGPGHWFALRGCSDFTGWHCERSMQGYVWVMP